MKEFHIIFDIFQFTYNYIQYLTHKVFIFILKPCFLHFPILQEIKLKHFIHAKHPPLFLKLVQLVIYYLTYFYIIIVIKIYQVAENQRIQFYPKNRNQQKLENQILQRRIFQKQIFISLEPKKPSSTFKKLLKKYQFFIILGQIVVSILKLIFLFD